jgi:hypothetical protein
MALSEFKWNGPALVAYNEKQLKAALKAVAITFQKIVRKRAGIINKRQIIKLKRKKGKSTLRKAGSRIPIYIPGVGWRMSKNVRKRGGKANKTQITIYPHSSRPGEPVRRRTGVGQKNIVQGVEGLRARVGYTKNARYMTMHELGIKYPKGKQRRPLMVPALRDTHPQLANVMRAAADRTKP